jgi:hypothetical protein
MLIGRNVTQPYSVDPYEALMWGVFARAARDACGYSPEYRSEAINWLGDPTVRELARVLDVELPRRMLAEQDLMNVRLRRGYPSRRQPQREEQN